MAHIKLFVGTGVCGGVCYLVVKYVNKMNTLGIKIDTQANTTHTLINKILPKLSSIQDGVEKISKKKLGPERLGPTGRNIRSWDEISAKVYKKQ